MATRMTSKGQVTIPKAVREHLGIGPGSAVEFALATDGNVVVRAATKTRRSRTRTPVRDRWSALRGSLKSSMTTDEIMKLLRG
jgi:AbrB family looped-hinge helix DNA binding protein